MFTLRPAAEGGHANHGWLDSWHSFSFADYRDPQHMHWGPLRVINEGRVAPGAGFPTHSHQDMEIITYVLEGELAHKDSMGNGSIIRPGDVQRMSAGRGVQHSEFNHSRAQLKLGSTRLAYVQVARGAVAVNGQKLATGDGALIGNERELALDGGAGAEVLLFDLPTLA